MFIYKQAFLGNRNFYVASTASIILLFIILFISVFIYKILYSNIIEAVEAT